MKTKIDIKNIGSKVIFSFEAEDNTLRKTVEQAVRQGVSLKGANLVDADLNGADLNGADLSGAVLMGANLSSTDLSYANLFLSCLGISNLREAKLSYTILRYAELNGADLEGVDLEWADMYGAKLFGAKNVPYLPLACPSEGEFIGWKKIKTYKEDYDGDFLVKLFIPEDAKRCSATTEKCRCDKAKVLKITNIKTGEHVDVITNANDGTFVHKPECVYRVGEMVYPDSFDEDRWFECSNGIHFFINKQSAINY